MLLVRSLTCIDFIVCDHTINSSIYSAGKRKYESMKTAEVTQEDMEVYKMKKTNMEDPMANYVDEEDR